MAANREPAGDRAGLVAEPEVLDTVKLSLNRDRVPPDWSDAIDSWILSLSGSRHKAALCGVSMERLRRYWVACLAQRPERRRATR
jgi:hypothetical protein